MKRTPHYSTLKPGEDPTAHIASLYEEGRVHPHGKSPTDYSRSPAELPQYGGGDGLELDHTGTTNMQAPQDPEDQHAPGYDNEVSVRSWLRGGADYPHPDFDQGPSGHRYGRK